jgi:hypothetical protein
MPSQQMRFCTNYFKAAPIDKYLKEQGECELMIGFNYDEQGRTGSLEAMPNVKYTYPLIEDGSKLIEKWLTNKNTIEFLGIWEQLNNKNFNTPEFGGIMNEAGPLFTS